MRPEPAPVLTGKCAKEFVKRVEAPPTQKSIDIFKEAEKIRKAIRQTE
jgi:hypothetical protein